MSETIVINPILVQAYHPDIPPAPDNVRLSDHVFDATAQEAFEQRLANQSRQGANPGGYVDLSRPDVLTTLAPEHHAAYEIARMAADATPGSVPYFLAETALHHDRLYEDLWPRYLGGNALLRVEEGLTWRAFETRRELERRLATRSEMGKTYVQLPGFDSPVATAGWWRDVSEPDPIKRAEQSITEIPSCEVFMSCEIEDQAEYADGGSVVRIVPSSMEDREATAVRILNFLGTYPAMHSLSSIIVNPGGDIKKIRHWDDRQMPSDLSELIGPMRTNDQVKRLTSTFSNKSSNLYADAFKSLPRDVRRHMTSPNDRKGSVSERLGKFQVLPYPMYPIVEMIRPTPGMTAHALRQLMEGLGGVEDIARTCIPHSKHYIGRGTNNVFHVRLPLYEGRLMNGDRGKITGNFFFSRVDDDQQAYLQSLPDIFRFSSHAFGDFLEHLVVDGHEPYYALVEAARTRSYE